MLNLGDRWAGILAAESESGMGYQVVSIHLVDGRRYDRVTVSGGHITAIPGCDGIPFTEEQIERIVVTHDRVRGG
jgi:hypothetical protein